MTIFALLITSKATISTRDIENALPESVHWSRMNPNIWFLDSDLTAQQIFDAVKPALAHESILVIEVDINHRRGWVEQVVVDWLSDRDRPPQIAGGPNP